MFALCALEQAINWGNAQWQKWSNFPRSYDMVTGFALHAFDTGIDSIPYWTYSNNTPYFGSSGYRNYPEKFKVYFNELNTYNNITPILSGNILDLFIDVLTTKNTHPEIYA